jgi:hypothetical protein
MKFSMGMAYDRAACRENRHHFRRKQQLLLELLTWCLTEMCFYEIAMSAVGIVKVRSIFFP